MVRVGIGLSMLVVVGWIALSVYLVRTEADEYLDAWVVVLLAAGWAFVALVVVWVGVGLASWIRRVMRATRDLRDDNFAKPS